MSFSDEPLDEMADAMGAMIGENEELKLQNIDLREALMHMKICSRCAEESWEFCEGGRRALTVLGEHKQMNNKDKLVESVLDSFDFKAVEENMKSSDWAWYAGQGKYIVPKEPDLREMASRLLKQCVETGETCRVSSGGFEAEFDRGYLTLRFVVASATQPESDDV